MRIFPGIQISLPQQSLYTMAGRDLSSYDTKALPVADRRSAVERFVKGHSRLCQTFQVRGLNIIVYLRFSQPMPLVICNYKNNVEFLFMHLILSATPAVRLRYNTSGPPE